MSYASLVSYLISSFFINVIVNVLLVYAVIYFCNLDLTFSELQVDQH